MIMSGRDVDASVLCLFQMGCYWICKCMVTRIIWCKILPIILLIKTHSFPLFLFDCHNFHSNYWCFLVFFYASFYKEINLRSNWLWFSPDVGPSLDHSQKCTLFSTCGNWINLGGCVSDRVSKGIIRWSCSSLAIPLDGSICLSALLSFFLTFQRCSVEYNTK